MVKIAERPEWKNICVKPGSIWYVFNSGLGMWQATVLFLKLLTQRLVDMFIQEWSEAIQRDKDRYDNCRSFKTIFEKEKYILI